MMNTGRLYILLIYAVIFTLIGGDYFNGGTLTYKVSKISKSMISISVIQTYLYNYSEVYCNDTMINKQSTSLVYNSSSNVFNCTRHCNQPEEFKSIPMTTFCTDYSKPFDVTVGQRANVISMTEGSNFIIVSRSGAWRQLSLPIGLTGPVLWSVFCSIVLRVRSNGKYNSPPVATIISPIRIPMNKSQMISIPIIDADNDEIRCRFADNSDECRDVCYPTSLPNGTQLLANCTLLITGENADDWYGVTIMVEDFLNSTSIDPLSTIPVQFLVNVQNASTCRSPYLRSLTTKSGTCIGVLVGKSHRIRLTVKNFCPNTTTIEDIATLSFPNVSKTPIIRNTVSLWSTSLIWTPTMEQIGSQILCAVAIDSGNHQSNQYCITFIVSEEGTQSCPEIISTTQLTTIDSTMMSRSTTIDNLSSASFTSEYDNQTGVNNMTSSTADSQENTMNMTTSSLASVSQPNTDTNSHFSLLFNASTSPESTTTPNVKSSTTIPNAKSSTTISYAESSTTIPYTESSTVISKIPSTSRPTSTYTASTVALSPPNSSSPWYWAAPLIAVLGVGLIAIGIGCYCCCPTWCCCCKPRQKHAPTERLPQQKKIIHPPKKPYRVERVSERNLNHNNVREPHPPNIKNNHTPEIAPMPMSHPPDNAQHDSPTALTESYIFGNRHASKPNQP